MTWLAVIEGKGSDTLSSSDRVGLLYLYYYGIGELSVDHIPALARGSGSSTSPHSPE